MTIVLCMLAAITGFLIACLLKEAQKADAIARVRSKRTPKPEPTPRGRVELWCETGAVMGSSEWDYTDTMDTIRVEPLIVDTSGVAHAIKVYAPNGTWMTTIGMDAIQDATTGESWSSFWMAPGSVVDLYEVKLRHNPGVTVCPQCGYREVA